MSKKAKIIIVSSVFVFISVMIYFTQVVNPVIVIYSHAQVSSLAAKAINMAVSEVLSDYIMYEELVKVTKNEAGDVALIEANAIEMNKLAKNLVKIAQNRIELIGAQGLRVPIGTFTGVPILIGRGPYLKIKLAPIGAITSEFKSHFDAVGINNTRHSIFINLESSISVALPIKSTIIKTKNQILFCDSIIVGKVPDTYLSSERLEHMLNLIPN